MKGRWKIYLGIVLAVVVVGQAVVYFPVETSALVWHIKHGFHAELGDIRVHVPFSYEASDPQGLGYISLSRYSGKFWDGFSDITIDLQNRNHAGNLPSVMERLGLKKVYEQPTTFAGRSGVCVDYTHDVQDTGGDPVAHVLLLTRETFCVFGDSAIVHFMGTPDLKEDFYKILETAEPIRRKT